MVVEAIAADELLLFKPETVEERRLRALFLSTQMSRHSLRMLKMWLDHCTSAARAAGRPVAPPTTWEHQQVLKILTTAELWLALKAQAQVAQADWLTELFREAWAQSDVLNGQPPSATVLTHFKGGQDYRSYCEAVAMQVCHELKLGALVDDALIYVSQTLGDAWSSRGEIVRHAITAPVAELRELAEAGVPV